MKKDKGLQTIIISILAIAILVMSIGFASYAQNLNISGTATFAGAKWDVHFDTSSFNETGTITSSPAATISTTDIAYTVALAEPGDVYTFDVDVVNNGTFDASLTSITIVPAVGSVPDYLEHTITYDGHDYTATTTSGINSILPKKTNNVPGSKTLTVTVKYRDDVAENLLPDTAESVNLAVMLHFDQVE
jgi:hypothetical protein